jgi:hypothetical protein
MIVMVFVCRLVLSVLISGDKRHKVHNKVGLFLGGGGDLAKPTAIGTFIPATIYGGASCRSY